MATFTFDAVVAYAPASDAFLPGVLGNIYLDTDTAYATPLTVTPEGGSATTQLTSRTSGLIPRFTLDQSANSLTGKQGTRVVWKSGVHVVSITSIPFIMDELKQVRTVTATGTDTTAIQDALNAAGTGGVVRLIGDYTVSSTLTISTSGVTLELVSGSKITTSVSAADAIAVTAADVTIRGGGSIVSPATFSGTNVQPTYAVIRATANGLTVDGIRLVNVPKVGVYGDEVDELTVTGCHITGNYPPGSWTGTETGHFGVAVNPTAAVTAGRVVVSGNYVRSCVQGVYVGNYGAAATAYGVVVSGNVFDGCHNHGVYNAGGVDGCTVTGNTFTRCSLPVAMTGSGHVVSNNAMFTHGTGNNLDLAGISMRDPVGCVVSGNTIKGDAPASSTIIDLGNYATSTTVTGNVVTGNTIATTGGSATAIRVGRSTLTDTCHDNVVSNNRVSGNGVTNVGLIAVTPASGAVARANKITGNVIVVKNQCHGISASNAQHTTIQNNTVRFEYNAGSAQTVGGVFLATATRSVVGGNDFCNLDGMGTNLTVRAIWEGTGCANNSYVMDRHDPATGLAGYTPYFLQSGSDAFLDVVYTGAPGIVGAPGSRWSRLDGGASTSLYVKETASTSATWRAV